MKLLISLLLATFIGAFAFAHGGDEQRISIEPEIQGPYQAGSIDYSFQLFDEETQKAVGATDLVETHTKILHMIAYDQSRNEFSHVHPEFQNKTWSVNLDLPTNGSYFIWAQGQLQDGTEFSTFVKSQIVNGKPELPAKPLGDQRKSTDKGTTLELDKTQIRAGKMVMVNFKVTREDGQAPEISPYLGALAHVIAASPDGDELIHVHPMAGGSPNTGMIHATFPTEGDYRLWVQLIDKGELKTIPLSVTVFK